MNRIPITNQFMFRRVMQDEDICKEFIYSVLGIKVDAIEYQNFEQILEPTIDLRSVRLDLLVRAAGRIYNVELQCQMDESFLKRLRYYQASIDTTLLDKGEQFETINDSYIIFLCTFDAFGKGFSRYTIDRTCLEASDIKIDDGAHWIVLNTRAFENESRKNLRELLQYFETGELYSDNSLVCKLNDAVNQANLDRQWVRRMESVMNAYDEATWRGYSKGEKAGLAKGLEQGKAEGKAQIASLMAMLFDAGRIEDAKKASVDEEFCQTLISEYAL